MVLKNTICKSSAMEKRTFKEPTYVRATLVEAFDKFENGELSLKELRAINREMRQALRNHQPDHKQPASENWFGRFVSNSKSRLLSFLKL